MFAGAPVWEVLDGARLGPRDAAALAMDSSSPFQTAEYAAALAAAGAAVRIVRVGPREAAVGHVVLLEQERFGFRSWLGLSGPALASGMDSAPAFFDGLLAAARASHALAVAWRENATTRFPEAVADAAFRAVERGGGAAVPSSLMTFALKLSDGAEAVWAGMHRKQRNAVRAAERAGCVAQAAPRAGFARLYAPLSAATFARSEAPGPAEPYFEKLLEADWARPYVCMADRRPVAAAIVTVHGGSACYLHGASSGEVSGAAALLQWRVVQDLVAESVRRYDLGGCVVPGSPGDSPRMAGIRRFKARFGGASEKWPGLQLLPDPSAYAAARARVQAALNLK